MVKSNKRYKATLLDIFDRLVSANLIFVGRPTTHTAQHLKCILWEMHFMEKSIH